MSPAPWLGTPDISLMLQRPRRAPPPGAVPPPPRAAAPAPSWTAAWRAPTRRPSTSNPSCFELATPCQSFLELVRAASGANQGQTRGGQQTGAETREKVAQNLVMIIEWPRGNSGFDNQPYWEEGSWAIVCKETN